MKLPVLLGVAALVLALAGDAIACACVDAPLDERLDDADAAVVGRVVAEGTRDLRGIPQRLLTIEVDQRVKGEVERTLVVRSPSGTSCDIDGTVSNAPIGLLLMRAPDDAWLGSACSIVDPGELVAAGGEPRGGVIKVVIGLVILGLVLLWALVRLRRGSRPQLPGAPEP